MNSRISIHMLSLAALVFLFTSACSKNSLDPVYKAACYFDGHTVQVDKREAFHLYQKAVDDGDKRAMPLLACCYMFGIGVEKDETTARALYRRFAQILPEDIAALPIEIMIKISDTDDVIIDKQSYDNESFTNSISATRDLAMDSGSLFLVNIEPHPDTSHLRILDVMDACYKMGTQYIFFFDEGGPERQRVILRKE